MSDPNEPNGMPKQPEREAFAFHVFPLQETSTVRLGDIVDTLWSGKVLILAIASAFTLLAVVTSYVMTPVFRAETLVKPVTGDSQSSTLAALTGQFAGAAALAGLGMQPSGTAEYIATLRSRSFAEMFIETNELLPVLFAEQWNEKANEWHRGDVPTTWDAYRRFDSIRNVSEDAVTGLVTVSVEWTDPGTAAKWANGIVGSANKILRDKAIQEANRSLEYLEASLQESSPIELRQAVFRLMATEMKNAMLATVRSEYAFRVLDPAVPPERRHRPNRLLLTAIGVITGILIGVFVVFFRHMMKQYYRHS